MVGIKDLLGSKTRRLVGIKDVGSKTRDQRLVGIKDWVVGIADLGSMTPLDQRLVWIEDLFGSKTRWDRRRFQVVVVRASCCSVWENLVVVVPFSSCCGSRKILFFVELWDCTRIYM
jgi:hypothetical protein